MTSFRTILLATALAGTGLAASGAAAQTVATANPEAAIANSKAYTGAMTQIQTTYKAQIDQAEARRRAITAELQPLATKLEADQKANVAQATLQTEYQQIQARQTAGQQELARIAAPAERARAYAVEQISGRLNEAVGNVIKARNVSMLVRPDAVMLAQPASDLTTAVTAELDRLVPTVSIAVPANWQPGQQQAAAAAAPAASAPATTSTRKQPQGR